ncbi:MAG TPA: DUF3108 domain-containing protein [Pyrinomonadaceae bacterium]|nr:DUF3108 domain-containing protein [Pyrinomonadaceae bacterium]
MNQRLKPPAIFSSFVLLAVLAISSGSQVVSGQDSQPFSPAPYRVGERLTYNVSFSNFVSAAHIELLVAAHGNFFDRDAIQLKGHIETTGMVNAALFAVNNDYITYIDPASGMPFRGQQILRAASRTSDTSADFNQPAGVAALPVKRTAEFPGTYDFLSAIYRVRALPLAQGSTYVMTVRDGGDTYDVELRVNGNEAIKTNVGSFNTIVCRLRFRNNSALNGYNVWVFFSDDQRHVPVLITAHHSAGEIRAELAGSEFIATPPVPPTPGPTPTAITPVVDPRRVITPPVGDGKPPAGNPDSSTDAGALGELPFKVGEQLNYRVFLPNITLPVAAANFQVRARSKYFDHDGLLFTVGAQTSNALQTLFVANDVITSYVDPKTLLPFHTEFSFNEGRRRFASKLAINQDYGAAVSETGARIEIPVGTHDYLSFFYALRTFNLTPPRRNAISILVNNKPKTLFITAIRKENVQLGTQTIPAIQISLTTDDAESDKYQLRAWISDDSRRLPLRLTAMTKLGALRADLAIIPVTRQ